MKEMVFVLIPAGKFPKTRKQLAKDSGKKEVMKMYLPVFYADEDSKIIFTDLAFVDAYARSKKRMAVFVEAGEK